MKKYYPKITENMVSATPIAPSEFGGTKYLFSLDDNGDVYVADTSRIYKSSNLYRNEERELVLTVSSQVLHVERMSNGKILVIHFNGVWIADDSSGGTWRYEATRTGQWGVASQPFPTLKNVDVHDNVILVSCYGTKSSTADFKGWISRDYGETWKEIYSTKNMSPNPDNAHIHGMVFDKYRNYIWIIIGDDDNSRLMYSDSWGDSWENVSTSPGFIPMLTEIFVLPNSIVVGTDTAPDALISIPFRENRGQPTPDVNNMSVFPLRSDLSDDNMYGFFLRGVSDTDVYPHKLVAVFPGHSPFDMMHQVWYSYNGNDWWQIHGNNTHDGINKTTPRTGEIKIEYLVAITKPDFKIDGEDAGNVAWGRGHIWNGEKWELATVEIKLPEWVLVE